MTTITFQNKPSMPRIVQALEEIARMDFGLNVKITAVKKEVDKDGK